jgi:hypothetical protein
MTTPLRAYDTVTEAVNDLTRRGYTVDLTLNAEKDCLACSDLFTELSPDKFRIDEVYRFEGVTDPGDEMIVFAISSLDEKIKGVVVNAFGIYSSYRSSKLVEHLTTHINPEHET